MGMTHDGNAPGLDLYSFQPYDAIAGRLEADGAYIPDPGMSGLIGDDAHVMEHPDATGEERERELDEARQFRDMFTSAYRWLIGEMTAAGIEPATHPGAWAGPTDARTAATDGRRPDGDGAPNHDGDDGGTGTPTGPTATIPSSSRVPIWAYAKWTSWHDGEPTPRLRPDRRDAEFRNYTGDLIHLRIPAERVLLTDFDAWNAVINKWPTPPPASAFGLAEDDDAYTGIIDRYADAHDNDAPEELARAWRAETIIPTGHEPNRTYIRTVLDERNRNRTDPSITTGDRPATLPATTPMLDRTDDILTKLPDNNYVQATFWEILPGDIIEVKRKGATRWTKPRTAHRHHAGVTPQE